jgi:hypothetical protein
MAKEKEENIVHENNVKKEYPFNDTAHEEMEKSWGIPREELKTRKTSMVGRCIDVPVEVAGYPSKYDKDLEVRRKIAGEAEEAAEIINNNVL